MRNQTFRVLLAALIVLAASAPRAFAGESVQASIAIPVGEPQPLITTNGNPYAQGTYAVGTLQVEYTHVGYTFPTGAFASFTLGLSTVQTNGASTVYTAHLSLTQSGSSNVSLSASPASFALDGYPWSGSSTIGVSIPASVALDPLLNEDGTVIVGNLQLSGGAGERLGTPTSVQVRIRLVHPTSCVRQFTFLSDRDISGDFGALTLTYGTRGANVDRIMNMSPVSANAAAQVVLLVNTCDDDHVVDLRVQPDARFGFGPGNGNTTFVYSDDGELAPGAIDLSALSTVNQLSHTLDVTNLNVRAGQSVLVVVHLVLNNSLNRTTVGASPFVFASTAYEPGGTFTTFDSVVDPNPATREVTFTLVPQN